jgi:hypothetical protein
MRWAPYLLVVVGCGRYHFAQRSDAPIPDTPGSDAATACTALSVDTTGKATGQLPATSTTQGSCGGATLGEVIYQLDAAYSGGDVLVAGDFPGSSAGTVMYIRSACADPSTELACSYMDGNGDAPEIRLLGAAAGRYYVYVDGDGAGAYEVSLQTLLPAGAPCDPTNVRDRCGADLVCTGTCTPASCTITQALSGSTTYMVTADTSTGAVNDHAATCGDAHDGGVRAAERVYTVDVASSISDLVVSTDDAATTYDTLVYVRASCLGPEITCDDDSGTISLRSIAHTGPLAAGTYYVFIDGFGHATGSASVTITLTP